MSSPSSSSAACVRVILFGATGALGANIARAMISPQYKNCIDLTVAARSINPSDSSKSSLLSSLKAGGAHLVTADLDTDDVASLSKVVSGADVVLSAVGYTSTFEAGQLKLIEAATLAKVKHFIPSDFGGDLELLPRGGPVPIFDVKWRLHEAVKSSGLSYTFIASGSFMEYLIAPFAGVDVANACVSAPVSFDTALTTTSLADIGTLTADIVANYDKPYVKNQDVRLGAQTITYEEIAVELERKFNKTFSRVTLTAEELSAAVKADTTFQNFPARFQYLFGLHNAFVSWDVNEAYPHKYAPHIRLTSVKEYVAKLV